MNQNRNSHSSSRMTAQDVASLAGVSQSTVSRVFNPKWKGKVKPEIRERVLKIATETGYTPNTIAHILTSKRSGIVGVLVSKQYQAFYYAVLSEITACLNANGFQTMLFLTDPKMQLMICLPMYYAINWTELLLLQQRLPTIYTSPRQIFRFQRCCITVMCRGCLSARYIVTITQAVYRWQITL